MLYIKTLSIVALMLCIVPLVSAGNDTGNMFEETTDGLFNDLEVGLKDLVKAIIGVFALYSIAVTIIGWHTHNNTLFKRGVGGCGIIILSTILYFLAINGSDYFMKNYW